MELLQISDFVNWQFLFLSASLAQLYHASCGNHIFLLSIPLFLGSCLLLALEPLVPEVQRPRVLKTIVNDETFASHEFHIV